MLVFHHSLFVSKIRTDIVSLRREMDQIQKQTLLKAEKQEGYSFAKRLSKFCTASAEEKYFRITPSGTPWGLLMGTPTFLKVQEPDAKETKKTLYALEHGSSNALSSFQKVLVI